jgi:peptidoglycan hydrolase CwlO-like protein
MNIFDAEKHLKNVADNRAQFHSMLAPNPGIMEEVKQRAMASVDFKPHSWDLYSFSSIFLSTTWNDNDDILLPEEVWPARHTLRNHPVNLKHKTRDIVGHMTDSFVFNEKGEIIPDDIESYSGFMDLVAAGFIYTEWNDPDREQEIAEVISLIEDRKMFVSMEAVFTNFDYGFLEDDKSITIIERTAQTAYLTGHLKKFNGSGTFNGKRVGRVLRNMIFVGQGITDNPANKRSHFILQSDVTQDNIIHAQKNYENVVKANMEKNMTEKDIETLNATLASLSERLDTLTKEREQEKAEFAKLETKLQEVAVAKETLEKEKTDLEAQLAELRGSVEGLEKTKTEFEATVASLETQKTELEGQIKAFETEKVIASRVDELVACGVDRELAEKRAKDLVDLPENQWKAIAEVLAAVKPTEQVITETVITDTVDKNKTTASLTSTETPDKDKELNELNQLKQKMAEFIRGKK